MYLYLFVHSCIRYLCKWQMGEDWNDSLQSKEQIEVNLLHKYEAAMRRERALAYSFSHQVNIHPSTYFKKNPDFTYLDVY